MTESIVFVPTVDEKEFVFIPGGTPGPPGPPGTSGSGSTVAVKDEATLIGSSFTTLKITGAGVSATASGSEAVIDIPGGTASTAREKTPFDFGAVGGGADDGAEIQACIDWARTNGGTAKLAGDWSTSIGLVDDPGTYGTYGGYTIDFGKCRITALNAISIMWHCRDAIDDHYRGKCILRGTGYTSDTNASWTCDVGLRVENATDMIGAHFSLQAFSYAGIEVAHHPAANNTILWGKIDGKRIGSGQPTASRSRLANFSGATFNGAFGSAQYTQMTVDNLPSSYIPAGISPNYTPGKPLKAEIAGELFDVTYYQVTGANTAVIRVEPAVRHSIASASNPTGALKWHYGGLFVSTGNDSNIHRLPSISGVACGAILNIGNLYGHSIGVMNAASCGAACIVGPNTASQVWGLRIDTFYCESNTFDLVNMGNIGNTQIFIGSTPAMSGFQNFNVNRNLTAAETYAAYASHVMMGGPVVGYNYPRIVRTDIVSQALNFNDNRTFDTPKFMTTSGSDSFELTLVKPTAESMAYWGYREALVVVHGQGTNGEPTSGGTITPGSGEAINGPGNEALAANATLSLANFTGPAVLAIGYSGTNQWNIRIVSGKDGHVTTSSAATYSLGYADHKGYKILDHATPTLELPLNATKPLPIGFEMDFVGTNGVVTVTLESPGSMSLLSSGSDVTTAGAMAGGTVKKVGSNTWHLHGKLS